MKKELPYEYCASRFLLQWDRDEYYLYKKISKKPTPHDVREALGYFQAARSFTGLATKANKVVTSLLKYRNKINSNNVVSCVESLTIDFEKDFGKYNLAAATKLLWLSKRSPVIIMDSKARNALYYFGYDFEEDDYEEYYYCWIKEFNSGKIK